ncbi:hypothetical protein EZV62_002282 [Acer yangbiense]|uniref:FBD domain-containing protein n=1 Tax=Acer yangbiense TaxID=1000413 RepID=A0A5C7IWU5_9ROSI|nr:hypothetical protein EZV62_002282 [Acer yangbiense]
MEDIFTIGRRNDINSNEEIDRVVLDQLHLLSLYTLPKLRSFCSEAEVFASTSNEIILEDTPVPFFDGKVQLPNLKTLNLFEICGIEEIVAKEGAEDAAARTFVFPHLTCLKLHDLQELKCFYPGIHTIEWPVLKELELIGCDKMDHLFALELLTFQKNILAGQLDIPVQPLSLVKKVFSSLEKLILDGNSTRMIFQSQFSEIFFPKLELLGIRNQDYQPADLPLGFLQREL